MPRRDGKRGQRWRPPVHSRVQPHLLANTAPRKDMAQLGLHPEGEAGWQGRAERATTPPPVSEGGSSRMRGARSYRMLSPLHQAQRLVDGSYPPLSSATQAAAAVSGSPPAWPRTAPHQHPAGPARAFFPHPSPRTQRPAAPPPPPDPTHPHIALHSPIARRCQACSQRLSPALAASAPLPPFGPMQELVLAAAERPGPSPADGRSSPCLATESVRELLGRIKPRDRKEATRRAPQRHMTLTTMGTGAGQTTMGTGAGQGGGGTGSGGGGIRKRRTSVRMA